MSGVDITAAVCTYNRAPLLSGALESLVAQETRDRFSFEILVIDDASTDDTVQVVERFSSLSGVRVRYIRAEGRGIGPARNVAMKTAVGSWVAFMDDDERAAPGWLLALHAVASQTKAPVVGGPVRALLSESQLNLLSPSCQSVIGHGEYPYNSPTLLTGTWSPGCGNVILSTRIIDELGGFSDAPSAGEDNDLWRRVRSAGYEIWYAPDAVIHHVVPRYRLTTAYFRWNSQRWGDTFALQDWSNRGPVKTLILGAARIVKTCAVTLPGLVIARLRNDDRAALDFNCGIWRTQSYARRCLFLTSPRLFPQEQFFARLQFRGERASLTEEAGLPTKPPEIEGGG